VPVIAALIIATAFIALPAQAQDSHYWTQQYGNEARLMGGAVVGSTRDLSAVFYNPGRLALVDRPEFVIAGNVFQYGVTTVKGDDSGRGASSSRFALSPSLLAGELRLGFLGENGRLAYSFLTRQFSDVRMNRAFAVSGETGRPTEAQAQIDHRLSEYWAGFTYANKISSNVGVGVSMFVAPRSHRSNTSVTDFLAAGDLVQVSGGSRSYEYNQWSLLWKLGIGTTVESWDVGLTVTTPMARLFGSGQVSGTLVDLDNAGGDAVLITDFQRDLSTSLRSPWSVGLGASRDFGRSRLHVGAEWFASMAPYTMMEAVPTVPNVGASGELDLSVVDARKSVLNVAVGYERKHSETLTWYGSFHTDFSYDESLEASNLAFTRWNLYHIGGGARTMVGSSELTVGAIYAFSNGASARGFLGDVTTSYKRITVILGFNLPFGDSPTAG
jgi:hypothetical protein